MALRESKLRTHTEIDERMPARSCRAGRTHQNTPTAHSANSLTFSILYLGKMEHLTLLTC